MLSKNILLEAGVKFIQISVFQTNLNKLNISFRFNRLDIIPNYLKTLNGLRISLGNNKIWNIEQILHTGQYYCTTNTGILLGDEK